ncbi:hypothetical protein PTH_2130 [Pelotomaculum thermopropionicum SI]|uniref:Diguanylate cyclase n=1 Tax=Pelotomaculum thermopropionicum (strain DSM 13744 / JCM 10971 / SI) TaxID=370438 RepID=A5D0C2_PELTS|nr:hypothetical protein PTH_2130 [Pelotomaculum thermopropionicum SI]
MVKWEDDRKNKISEHILVTHIIFVFVFFMALLAMLKTTPDRPSEVFTIILLAISLIGTLVIVYASKKLSSGLTLAGKPGLADISLFLFSFFIAASILFLTGKSDSPVKIVLLIPIIVASTSYGKTTGLVTGGFASAFLLVLDLLAGLDSAPSVKLQTDIINSTVMLTLAWFIGGLADVDKDIRVMLTDMANTDGLTGLFNHRYFHQSLQDHIKQARENNSQLSLIMFDIDYFKFYNDNYGHQKGDELLKEMGLILNTVVKSPCIAARYGGDEFTVIVPGSKERAMEIAEEIRQAIESQPFEGAAVQPKGKITVSLGVATFPKHGSTPKELIRSADEAMYKAKYQGNKAQLYFSVMDDLREGIAETERDLFNSIKTLITIINAKDRYTFGHSERVVHYSLRLAKQLELSKEDSVILRYAAFLHDIGKIEIDRELLNKIGPLKPREWAVLKKHPVWGSDIVRPIISLRKVIPVILHHHENFDGTGYPAGLAGEEIPLLARVLRIADSFDAMTTDRPYKKAKTAEQACEELRKFRGTLFDPYLVDLFVQIIQRKDTEQPVFKEPSAV